MCSETPRNDSLGWGICWSAPRFHITSKATLQSVCMVGTCSCGFDVGSTKLIVNLSLLFVDLTSKQQVGTNPTCITKTGHTVTELRTLLSFPALH